MSIDTRISHKNGSRGVHGKYANFAATKASVIKVSPIQQSETHPTWLYNWGC